MIRPGSSLVGEPLRFRRIDSPRFAPRQSLLPVRPIASLRRTLLLKRILDLVVATLLLVLAAPVIGVAALVIRITSRGPAFYTQLRVGKFGCLFTIFKLRTMYHDCERRTGPTWSRPGDPRVTPLGRFLRAWYIDELPQLVNVIRGEMSLVGPRPERPEIVAQLARHVDGYCNRLAVLPGITGHAQVHLPPDSTLADVRSKLLLDIEYMARYSIWFDLVTLWRTALKMLGLYRRTGSSKACLARAEGNPPCLSV